MTVGVDLAVTTTSLLLSILDVEQQIMTGSPHLNSFSGQTSKIIRWPGLSYHWSGYYYYCRKKKGEEEEREGGVYRNPLIASNCPDPAVVRLLDGSGYALVASSDQATKSDNSSVFPVYFSTGHQPPVSPSFLITFPLTSPDLVNWSLESHIFSPASLPGWSRDRYYAPELHIVAGRYLLYFTAGDNQGKLSCGVAVASSEDPFSEYSVL